MANIDTVPSLEPDAAAMARMSSAIASYNAMRVGRQNDAVIQAACFLIPYTALVGSLAYAFWPGVSRDNFGTTVYYLAGAAAFFGGKKIWEYAWSGVANLRRTTRATIIPAVCSFVENIRYDSKSAPSFMRDLPAAALVAHDRIEHDDRIAGRYDEMNFELGEMIFWSKSGKNSEKRSFEGVVFHCNAKSGFPGILLVTKREGSFGWFMHGSKLDLGLKEIPCGNKRIAELYEFRTDNWLAAEHAIEGPLTTILFWLMENWPEGVARIALREEHIFLLVPTEKNHFEIPDISIELDYHLHVEPMTRQLWKLLSCGRLIRDILN